MLLQEDGRHDGLQANPGGNRGSILFIDAYDSFSENIIAMLRKTLEVQVTSIKMDAWSSTGLKSDQPATSVGFVEFVRQFDAIVVGPGPGHPGNPEDIGIIPEIWKLQDANLLPVLGICLGFQSLCLASGASINRLPLPCHGHVQQVQHNGTDIFKGVGDLEAINYHSLHVKLERTEHKIPVESFRSPVFRVEHSGNDSGYASPSTSSRASSAERGGRIPLLDLAWTDTNILMGVKHETKPFWGLQFHPESCKSGPACHDVIRNWWRSSQKWNAENDRKPQTIPELNLKNTLGKDIDSTKSSDKAESQHFKLLEPFQKLTESCIPEVKILAIPYHDELPLRSLQLSHEQSSEGMMAVLESTKKGRYSIFSLPSPTPWRLEYRTSSKTAELRFDDKISPIIAENVDISECIAQMTASRQVKNGPNDSPFWGGFMGYFSYEMGLEKYGRPPFVDQHSTADVSLLWVERCVILDHESRTAWLQSIRQGDEAWLHMEAQLLEQSHDVVSLAQRDQALEHSLQSRKVIMPNADHYKKQIRDCQQYLHSGDSYELCLTAETQVMLPPPQDFGSDSSHALSLYHRLRKFNPVPYAAYLSLGDIKVSSASPEQFIKWTREGQIDMIPMKGTVKKSPEMTLERACEILASPKEQAENLMIADLIRHDLYTLFDGKNEVEIIKLCDVVEHETVYQLVSHIRTTIPQSPGITGADQHVESLKHGQRALITTLPPGSMTGAPKKRSCEILSTLEARSRGLYSGAIGFLDLGGGGAFSVCIRTAFCHSRAQDESEVWRIGAGGAITVLSDEEAEWEEMKTKLDSVLKAFQPTSKSSM